MKTNTETNHEEHSLTGRYLDAACTREGVVGYEEMMRKVGTPLT